MNMTDMKKYILALTTVAFTLLPASAFAAECIVSESGAGSAKGTLRWALAKAMELSKGEVVQWVVQDKNALTLLRSAPQPVQPGKKKRQA